MVEPLTDDLALYRAMVAQVDLEAVAAELAALLRRPAWQADEPDGRRAVMSLGLLSSARGTEIFVNNAGFGRPKVSFDRKDKPWRTLASFAPIPTAAQWEAGSLKGIYYMGLFCLGPYFSGGLHFEPEHSPERGDARSTRARCPPNRMCGT